MLNRKFVFLLAFVPCLVASNALGVPTVKRLGMSNSAVGVKNAQKAENTSVADKSRVGVVRSNNLNLKPVTINKTAAKTENTNTDVRLSVGKYIHNQGVSSGLIKPYSSNAVVSSDEITNLKDKVFLLENQVAGLQSKLTAGDGIVIDGDVISVSGDLKDLPNDFTALSLQMDEKVDVANLASNYYTKSEVNQAINSQIIQGGDTVYDVASGTRKYVSIVDVFDTGILNQN